MAFTFPDPNLTPEFEGDNGITYQWDDVDSKWVVKGFSNDGDYVKRAGDSMNGDLTMNYSDIKLDPGDIIFQPIVPDGDPGGDQPGRWNKITSKRVRDKDGTVIGGSNDFGIRVDLSEGRTGYNKFEFFANVDSQSTGAKFADFGGGNNPTFRFKRGSFQMEGNRIQKLGDAQVSTDAVPYGQVIRELQNFRDDLIQDLAFGTWQYMSGSVTPNEGNFYASAGGGPIANADPRIVTALVFNVKDKEGSTGAFDRIEIGEMLTIKQGGLEVKYRVAAAPTPSGPSGEARFVEVNYISRNNSFTLVDGTDWTVTLTEFENLDVDALDDTYLRIDCDNSPLISSDGLEIKTDDERGDGYGEASLTLNGRRDNKNNAAATIKFKNWHYDDSDDVNGYITYRTVASGGFFRFNKPIDLHSQEIYNVENLKLNNPGSIWSDSNERIKFKTATGGNNGDGLIEFQRPGTNSRRGITIRGKDTSNADADILYTYTNSSGGDAINYVGKQTANSTNLATTKYVDNANTGVLEGKLKNKGSTGTPTSTQFVPMWGASYNSGNITDMNRIKLHSLNGYDFRTTGSAATPGTLTIGSRGDCLWHGIIEKKSVSGDDCTLYLVKLYAKSGTWDTSSDYYFHINGFKVDMS